MVFYGFSKYVRIRIRILKFLKLLLGGYTIIGYPLMLYCFDFSLPPPLKAWIKYGIMGIFGQIFIVGFFVLYQKYGFSRLGLVRALGVFAGF